MESMYNLTDRADNCGTLRDFVPFALFKKRENHPWRSVNFNKVADTKSRQLF